MILLQIFNRYLQRGGEDASVDRIFHHLAERHPVRRLAFESSAWTGDQAPPKWKQPFLLWHNPASIRQFKALIREQRPDCVLMHNPYPVGSAALYSAAHAARIPVVQYVHNFKPYSVNGYLWTANGLTPAGLRRNFWPEIIAGAWQESRLKTALFAAVLLALHWQGVFRRIHRWIAISEFMRDRFIEAGTPATRTHALRHSWDALPQAPPAEDDGSFLFLGRLIEAKGVGTLLQTWRRWWETQGSATPRLVIAGEGPMEAEVRAAAQAVGAIDYVGRVEGEAKRRLLTRCRAVVVPSLWWEPLGIVVYESYDHAKPVLAARSGGLTETVVDGETGWLHRPGEVEELRRQAEALTANKEAARRMGAAGRVWLLENTGKEGWNRAIDAILEKAMERR